jgi:hypothetical protein
LPISVVGFEKQSRRATRLRAAMTTGAESEFVQRLTTPDHHSSVRDHDGSNVCCRSTAAKHKVHLG